MSYVCASSVAIVCGVGIPDWRNLAPFGVIEGLYRTGSSISMGTRDVFNHTIKRNQWQFFLVEVFLDLSLVVSWLSWVCHVCSKPKPIHLNFNQADDHETKDVPNYHCWTCNSYRNHPPYVSCLSLCFGCPFIGVAGKERPCTAGEFIKKRSRVGIVCRMGLSTRSGRE